MSLMNSLILTLFVLIFTLTIVNILISSSYYIGLSQIIYLLATGQISHYIQKRNLVPGDLILIRYRGKYRKAYIVSVSLHTHSIQAKFFDSELNIDLVSGNWYPFSRIVIPDFMGKAAKVLYSDLED